MDSSLDTNFSGKKEKDLFQVIHDSHTVLPQISSKEVDFAT